MKNALLLTQSFRLGKPNQPMRQFPRDVIATFFEVHTRNWVLALAKEKGFLKYKQNKLQVFPDLKPKTLQKFRELKDIMNALREANIRHRWASPLKLQILYKGKSIFIRSEEEGLEYICTHKRSLFSGF